MAPAIPLDHHHHQENTMNVKVIAGIDATGFGDKEISAPVQ